MIHVFIGTKAQLIKMAPVMSQLRDRKLRYRYVDSGQHAGITRSLRRVFGIPEPNVSLRTQSNDIVTIPASARWYFKHLGASAFRKKWLQENVFPGGGVCLVHGDTLSTLLGMQMARAADLDVAHVESGLRSFRIWDPFPEELIRIRCMKRARVLFAPSQEAADNLTAMKVRGKIVQTEGNTVADSLRLMDSVSPNVTIPSEPFALFTCHRLETIKRQSRLAKVVDLANRAAKRNHVVFVRHKPTLNSLRRFGLEERLCPDITKVDMLDYCDFVALMKAARYVVSDGGSIQEECSYLNKPLLIIRNTTERHDGVGQGAVIWGFDDEVAEQFLDQRLTDVNRQTPPSLRPSERIVDTLREMGY